MKFKILSMLITLGVLAVMPMIYMGKFEPMAFFSSGVQDSVSEFNKLKANATNGFAGVVGNEKVQIYKWRDKNGVMQFSHVPPASGGFSEKVELNPNTNIVQAVKVPQVEKEQPNEVAQIEKPNPYSIKSAKKVLQDAKGIEAMLQKRHEEQQKMLGDL